MSGDDSGPFGNVMHLVRMACIFLAGIGLFLVARATLVPDDFGEWGHYRSGAVAENADKPMRFAGRAACADCHGDVVEVKAAGAHAGLGCEGCHGALATHAADPDTVKPQKPTAAKLCPVCHQQNVAKPKTFPQVDAEAHSGGEPCDSCHQAHSPKI
ncbi:MAG: cytochrome c3 family protein [Thermoanaerobaculia bacterium]